MLSKPKHLLFYDGQCGLCDHIVQFILKIDHRGDFAFAPLQGESAAKMLREVPEEVKQADSLILIENYLTDKPQRYMFGKGAFRTLWLIGGWWALIGWKSFLPPFLYDWAYRLVAKNRHRFFSQDSCRLPSADTHNRFLK